MTKAQLSEWIPDYSGVLMLTTSRRPIWSANAKEPVALFDYSEEEWSEIEAAPFRYRGRGSTQRLWSSMLPVGDGTARFLSQQRGELTMPCIVCQRQDATSMSGDGDFTRFDCRRCGAFVLSGTAESSLPAQLEKKPLRRSLMSHTLRSMQRPDSKTLRMISSEDLPTFWRNETLPTPQQQADSLILWIGDNQETAFKVASIERTAIAAWIGLAISQPDDSTGWVWLHDELKGQQLYQADVREGRSLDFRLTMKGWERYQNLKKTEIESRTAFMAMQYGDSVLNKVVADCFKPAVQRTGFELRLLTEKQPAGLIDDQLRAAILGSRFVISDLTHGNRGAYWEAGFGECLGLPVIYTCEKEVWESNKSHFDTNHLLTIIWDTAELKKAEDLLVATIRATFRADAKQTDVS